MPGTQQALTVEHVAPGSLVLDPGNARQIDEPTLDALGRSIHEFGFVEPVVARREDRVIIGGHQRVKAALRAGLETVPVIWLDISGDRARTLGLALNKITGTWDEQLLARLLADLEDTPEIDVSLTGFADDEISALLKSLEVAEKRDRIETFDLDSAIEAAATTSRSKPGDLWQLGDHRLLHGDATNADDIARVLGGGKAVMTFTDPPGHPGPRYRRSRRRPKGQGRSLQLGRPRHRRGSVRRLALGLLQGSRRPHHRVRADPLARRRAAS